MSSTRIGLRMNAPRAAVYRALLDARAVATWMAPTGMKSHVHAFDPREGGSFRISLRYDAPTGTGKTTAHTDTFHGRFAKLVADEQVVEVVEFETADPALRGEMTITIALADADGGTDVLAVHDGLPRGLSLADNEVGWRSSLAKLAALVEAGQGAPGPRGRPGGLEPALAGSAAMDLAGESPATVLLVPGLGSSGPDHWQSHWERALPGARRVVQQDWEVPPRSAWTETLDRAIAAVAGPVVLVGHSAGTMTIVHWAARARRPIRGALLVAPTDFEARLPDLPPPRAFADAGWAPIPEGRLPFPSTVVASSDDPYVSFPRARQFAERWGSRLVDLGASGHINVEAGFGPWPEGRRLLQDLLVPPAPAAGRDASPG